MILLDTHALVWLDEASPRLGRSAREMIDAAFRDNALFVSAISFWEVGTLARKGRIRLDMELDKWRQGLVENGLNELPVTGEIAARAALLDPFHGDPADRIIVASALQHSLALVTADARLLGRGLPLTGIDATE